MTTSTIAAIDKQIDANHRELRLRQFIKNTCSAADWQKAWDAQPELWERERNLFRLRGAAQQDRDVKAAAALAAQNKRTPRPKKCAACKGTGRATDAALIEAADFAEGVVGEAEAA